jgi:hypothetical protein
MPKLKKMKFCTDGHCSMYEAFDRSDGRCSYHGKIADGLMKPADWGTLQPIKPLATKTSHR